MSNPEMMPTSEKIGGQWISLDLTDSERVRHQLDNGIFGTNSFELDGGLVDPIVGVELDISQHEDGTLNTLSGCVTFDPTLTTIELEENWPTNVTKFLKHKIGYLKDVRAIYTLPHERDSFYAELDDRSTLHITTSSQLSECLVTIIGVDTDELHGLLGNEAETTEIGDVIIKDPYEIVKTTLRFLVAATDAVVDLTVAHPKIKPPIKHEHAIRLTDAHEHLQVDQPSAETDVATPGDTGFDSIGGLEQVKSRLREIVNIFRHPDLAKQYDISAGHILLYGPAGTGKTSLIQALASEIGASLQAYDSTDIIDKWVGNSGKNIKAIFDQAKQTDGPIVIFIDEIDTLINKSRGSSDERSDIKSIIRTELTDISENYPNIIFAGATNVDIDSLDPTITRAGRMEALYVPVPNTEERISVWQTILWRQIIKFQDAGAGIAEGDDQKSDPYDISEINFKRLAELTDGMTGADFVEILKKVRVSKFMASIATGQSSLITQRDIETCIQSHKRSQ